MSDLNQPAQPVNDAVLRHLLDTNQPASVLRILPEQAGLESLIYKCEALLELDQAQRALSLLDQNVKQLGSEIQLKARLLQAQGLIKTGWFDPAIIIATQTAKLAGNQDQVAEAQALAAIGYACKRCWNLSESNIGLALSTAPAHPRVLIAHARILIEEDQRLKARKIYEQLELLPMPWAKAYARWGQSYVAYLLGEFDRAIDLALQSLENSEEIIYPRFVIAQVALARNDLGNFEQMLSEIKIYSSQAESLAWLQVELEKLRQRVDHSLPNHHLRLAAFPSLVQRRNHCGPSTVELVLRYWKGGLDLTNEQIAERVKYPQGGTPIYRMREFFHLVGFETIRCQASIGMIKKLLKAGFPVIVQEEYANSSHVAVVIGYDPIQAAVELQDPMTHTIETISDDKLNHLRRNFLDSALIAFPRAVGHEQTLARLNIFVDQVLTWCDQAILEIDHGRYNNAASLMENAVQRKPELALAWMLLLHVYLDQWQQSQPERLSYVVLSDSETAGYRDIFFEALNRAKKYHSDNKFVHQFQGWGALLDHNYLFALDVFRKACVIDSDDAQNYASLAECYFALRDYESASEMALESLRRDASLPSANYWLARSLAAQQAEDAEHYARSAVDLDPHSWLSHLALAEVAINDGNLNLAHQEAEQAAALARDNPEVHLLGGILSGMEGEAELAVKQLLQLIEHSHQISPSVLYRALRTVAAQFLALNNISKALDQAQKILDLFPKEAWGLQFFAKVYCEKLLSGDHELHPSEISELVSLYEDAILANRGNSKIISECITYLEALGGPAVALKTAIHFQSLFPENKNLYFILGRLHRHLGDKAATVQAMLAAIREDGVHTLKEYEETIRTILIASGVEAAEKLMIPLIREINFPGSSKARNLAMAIASTPEIDRALAHELLRQVFNDFPQDAEVALAFGKVVQSEEDRENLYRYSLMISPDWPLARANLASYLLEKGRAAEALEFTRGYQYDAPDLLTVHGMILLQSGHYEEAIETFNQAIQDLDTPDSWLLTSRWQAEIRSGLYMQSLKTAQKGLRQYPEEPQWCLYVAESLRTLQRYSEANRMIKTAVRRGLSEADILRADIEIALDRHEIDNAVAKLDDLIGIEENQIGGQLSWAAAQRMRLLVEAGRDKDVLANLQSGNLSPEGLAEAAWIALMGGNPELAIALSKNVLSLDAHSYVGLVTFAQALAETDQEVKAIDAWYTLIDDYPKEHDAYEKLALYVTLDGKTGQGTIFAEQAVNLGSYCPFSWATRGMVMFFNDRHESAVRDLRTAWNRMDNQNRKRANEYWYLLAYLEQDQARIITYRDLAREQATSQFKNKLIDALESRML